MDKSLGKMRGTYGHYIQREGKAKCDIDEVAEIFAKDVKNVKKTFGYMKAVEVNMLAKAYLQLKYLNEVKHDRG